MGIFFLCVDLSKKTVDTLVMNEEDNEFASEAKIIAEIRYLHLEGFINVNFHPDYPGSYLDARITWRTTEESNEELKQLLGE